VAALNDVDFLSSFFSLSTSASGALLKTTSFEGLCFFTITFILLFGAGSSRWFCSTWLVEVQFNFINNIWHNEITNQQFKFQNPTPTLNITLTYQQQTILLTSNSRTPPHF
jgi:hypothetical protein